MSEELFTKELLENVSSLEELLGLQNGFFRHLVEEDDWSFIIKTHALLESALTRLLEVKIGAVIPEAFINRLDFAAGRHSKVSLLSLLKLLDSDDPKFVRGLSRIRNRLVHNIRHVNFNLTDYAASLSPEDSEQFLKESCCTFYSDEWPIGEARKQQRGRMLASPKTYIWSTALFFLALNFLRIDNARLQTEITEYKRQTLEAEAKQARLVTSRLSREFSASDAYKALIEKYRLEK